MGRTPCGSGPSRQDVGSVGAIIPCGMSPEHPFGSPPSLAEALAGAAQQLAPAFTHSGSPSEGRVRLSSDDPSLPDVELRFLRDRRLFSRTWPLVIESAVAGQGPARSVALALHRRWLGRRTELRPAAGGGTEAAPWAGRFAAAGVLEGAATMTGVQDLRLTWEPRHERWTLRIHTLAGALIGTAPSSAIAVGFEPEDVDGLLRVLRAFRAAALSPP